MKNCKECGTSFEPKSYQQEYCCSNCKMKASRKRQLEKQKQERLLEFEANKIGECPVCGLKFERTYGRTWRQQKYCSYTCRRRAETLFQGKSEKDLQYKDMIRFDGNKANVLRRDNCRCQFCNADKNLIIHHLDGSGNSDTPNNEMDNLVTLCRKCHARLHQYIDTFNNI